jgi:enterochelin esterase-like enzyme
MRALVLAALLVAGCDGCAHHAPPTAHASTSSPSIAAAPSVSASGRRAPSPAKPVPARELTWVYRNNAVGPMQVVVSIPAHRPDQKFPVLVALHGRGEAFKGAARGARGWVEDYRMPEAIERLRHPPLTDQDFGGMSDPARLARINTSLAKQPYRGLIVVCPYTPDILAGDRPFSAAKPLSHFVVDELLPRVYRETPAIGTQASTGIDGVSLGGRASLLVGFMRPDAFHVVASLQAAFDAAEAPALIRLADKARQENPGLVIRLLTSSHDFFREDNYEIAHEMTRAGIPHELVEVRGTHSYQFNRGPGVYEMLLFHDRTLRGEPALDSRHDGGRAR